MRAPAPRVRCTAVARTDLAERFWKDPSPCLANNQQSRWTSVSAALAVYLTQEQRTRIRRMQVARPTALPEPIGNGPFKGLYVIANKWHALLQDGLYPVNPDPDGSTTIVDPLDPTQTGPALQSDLDGNWVP